MRIKPRTRRLLWDLVTVLAAVGIAYSTIELIEYHGTVKGLAGALVAVVFGMICVEVLYPLWFGSGR